MVTIRLIVIALAGFVSASSANEPLTYALSKDCLEKVEIESSEEPGTWWLAMTARADESLRIEHFTRQHLGHKLLIVNSEGAPLIPEPVTILTPLSKRLRIVASTRDDAQRVVRLLAVGGKCGPAT